MTETFPITLLCDHIIQDTNNKHSAIGIYSGDVVVGEMPANLRLSLYVIFLPPEDGTHHIELGFFLDEGEYAKAIVDMYLAQAGVATALIFPNLEVAVASDTNIVVRAAVNNTEPETILKKRVYKGVITRSSVSVQPSSQSPTAS